MRDKNVIRRIMAEAAKIGGYTPTSYTYDEVIAVADMVDGGAEAKDVAEYITMTREIDDEE